MGKNRVLPASHALVFLLIHLGTGLAAPVLSLMLLARGATLGTLPLVVGVTTVVTCLCEVPSGIAADVLGRRRVFALSIALQVATYVVLLATPSLAVVAVSGVLRGLALAARTGTLEAVELDRVVAEHTEASDRLAALAALNGRFALLESAGVGAGAIAGGVLATLDLSYVLLICCIIASGAAALAGGLALFSAAASVPVFVAVYVALYLALGARSVIEQTVLHNAVPSRERSGMASVQSIALRAGGLAGSVASGPAVAALALSGAWPVIAVLAVALVALGVRRR